jgi:hypothetical protein
MGSETGKGSWSWYGFLWDASIGPFRAQRPEVDSGPGQVER